ncbi:MAG: metal-dependent transcriptional regulator [Ruminococcus sp.]|nr:metal-dependent transcriptional regulator [Ruminococcus sp.]
MEIKESAENYLETILVLSQKNAAVRSIDIANEMNFTKASISIAMKRLREDGYINMDDDRMITLTPKGRDIASMVYERHQIIAKILIALGVDEATAYEDSCKIEHDLSQKSFEKIKEFYENYKNIT